VSCLLRESPPAAHRVAGPLRTAGLRAILIHPRAARQGHPHLLPHCGQRVRGSCGAHLAATSRVISVCSQVPLDCKIIMAWFAHDRRLWYVSMQFEAKSALGFRGSTHSSRSAGVGVADLLWWLYESREGWWHADVSQTAIMKPAASAGRRHWEHRAAVGRKAPLGAQADRIVGWSATFCPLTWSSWGVCVKAMTS